MSIQCTEKKTDNDASVFRTLEIPKKYKEYLVRTKWTEHWIKKKNMIKNHKKKLLFQPGGNQRKITTKKEEESS